MQIDKPTSQLAHKQQCERIGSKQNDKPCTLQIGLRTFHRPLTTLANLLSTMAFISIPNKGAMFDDKSTIGSSNLQRQQISARLAPLTGTLSGN